MSERRVLCWARAVAMAVILCLPLMATAKPQVLWLGLLLPADDERLTAARIEQAYPGHPLGPATQGVEVALRESAFELQAAGVEVKLDVQAVRTPQEARAAAQRLARAGATAVLADLPAEALLAAADAVTLPVLNLGSASDALREGQCRAHLFHTLPSERMRADALAQYLVARRWAQVLLLHGPRPEDLERLATVQRSLKRYGLKVAAQRAFKLSADPRERQLAHPQLLTGGVAADVVWVVDSDGEFARSLPYRTAQPRPVVGDAGLTALAWAPRFERYGAPQLSRRFARQAGREMTAHDWAAWAAAKAVVQAALSRPAQDASLAAVWAAPGFVLDGFKGVRLGFRAWDGQLRQPLLLSDGQGVVATAPVDGLLHPSNVLDTLGADAPERLCRARRAP